MKKLILALTIVFGSLTAQAQRPSDSCVQSLYSAYAEIPNSMLNLCNYANPLSARAIDTYTKRYTMLPLDIMELLIAVKTAKQLNCVQWVAQNYTSVTQYFIARVCFDARYLNY